MDQLNPSFREIEHKFVVEESFDKNLFCKKLTNLRPHRYNQICVRDTYYVLHNCPNYVYRHRKDAELHQLTIKSIEVDNEDRLEVNLELDSKYGDQAERVQAFLHPLGIKWCGIIEKEVDVFTFRDCEVVYYRASFDNKDICCVEVEALGNTSRSEALAILAKYEEALGFDAKSRNKKSLFHLLVQPVLPS